MGITNINEIELKKLSEQFNCKCQIISNRTINVTTRGKWGNEYWVLELYDDKIEILHKNNTKSGKLHYHKQREVSNIHHAFQSISTHVAKYNRVRNLTRMEMLFNQIESNTYKNCRTN